MILYTYLPYEMVFPVDETSYSKEQTIEIDGGLLVVEPISANEYKIVRLISSDPNLYLNEQYSPGQMITMSFNL